MTGELDKFFAKEQSAASPFGLLETRLEQIWDIARGLKMDPYSTHFDVIPPTQMHEIASYGLPHRFAHWTHGRAYRQHKTMHEYGMTRLYEVVINADPSQAYLLENNSDIENTVVMGHVLGHTDFFKNNRLFQQTRRDMPHSASTHADRVKQLEFEHGRVEVEKYLDAALSIAEHVDPHNVVRPTKQEQIKQWRQQFEDDNRPRQAKSEFDDLFPEDRESEKKRIEEASKLRMTVPYRPDKDLLGFIADYSQYLDSWQREVIEIVRGESLYFHPQRRTKIMNEGYASYSHKRIMREMSDRGYLNQEEDIRWLAMHAGVVAPNPKKLNPYYFGMMMFEFLEDLHNGNLTDKEKRQLEKAEMPVYPKYKGDYVDSPGHRMVRETMMMDDDQSFIRNHFCQVPAERMNMYLYVEEEKGDQVVSTVVDKGWEQIRDNLVASMNNSGDPYLAVVDADHNRKGELLIKHSFEGRELDIDYLKKVLPYIHTLWGRTVGVETVVGDTRVTFFYDGKEISRKS